MGNMLGADPAQLRELAATAVREGERLEQTSAMITGVMKKAQWHGTDADRFRSLWHSQHRQSLHKVALNLDEMAKILQRNAEEQEKASSANFGGSTGSGDGSPQDHPGDPEVVPGMGKYEKLPDEIPFDDRALDPANMKQGQLGDCWFLAAAGAVAKNDPDWIRDHVWQNEDGTWTVKMYKDGKPVLITVEPTVPHASARDAAGNANWLSIYEKAAAEYFGGDYADLDLGFSDKGLAAITGQETQRTGESGFDDIEQRLKNGPVALGTEGERDLSWFFWQDQVDDNRIVPSHAYIVDGFENRVNPDTGKTERMIHVINPWGPEGGNLEGDTPPQGQNQRWGDLWLTEQQYKENFDTVYSSKSTKG